MRKAVATFLTGFVIGLGLMTGPGKPPDAKVPVMGHTARSGQWPRVRAEHLKEEPACMICGSTKNVEVHHVKPFAEHPELELNPGNLITLCSNPSCASHLAIGHLGNYKRSNVHVREDAALLRKRRVESQ